MNQAPSAFTTQDIPPLPGADGSLSGLTFAVKDLIDVAGIVSGWGNPDRAAQSAPALATAPVVLAMLMQGAKLVGKTHTDELACGMFGLNPHYGTPLNPAAPARVPGGSSSGSASAVAAGLVDFALGTDTGGSVRAPASFCGLYGLRTSFGRLSTAGIMPMAPSFDTLGWLARDAAMMRRVGEGFFAPLLDPPQPPRLLLARDAFAIPDRNIALSLRAAAQRLGPAREITLYGDGAESWLEVFRPLQLQDLHATLGAWAMAPGRRLSEAVRARFELAATIDPQAVAKAAIKREALTDRLSQLLGDDGFLILPTVHDLPPERDVPVAAQIAFREKTLALTCVASLCRLPQLNIPAGMVENCPVGLSLIGGPRADEKLLAFAESLV